MVKASILLAILSGITPLLFSCASNSNILTAVSGDEDVNSMPGESTESPAYQKLMKALEKVGYQGVGLKYEAPATLDLLTRVFSDPKAANRQIALVYTGLSLSYDPSYKSLTVGGTQDVNTILAYIHKNVPAKTPPSP